MQVAAVAHKEEKERLARSTDRRKADRVERLLAGEALEEEDAGYGIEGIWHLAVIATGPTPRRVITKLAGDLECKTLAEERDKRTTWGWLGSPEPIPRRKLDDAMGTFGSGTTAATGEMQFGLRGWRESHRQAQAALAVAQRRGQPVTRWIDVSVEALIVEDETLARQLLRAYLGLLAADDMQEFRKTMRAYLGSGHVAKTAAVRLNVHRRTVESRRNAVLELLDYDVPARHAELDLALRIYELLEGHE